jgi:uncharacterized phage protein (TIGR02216 family)
MAFGLGRLGLSPREFWQTTLPEIAAALEGQLGPSAAPVIERRDVDALLARFPDVSRSVSC